ncbi:MAG: 1-acyl-sn-glycerol-3-phosphate acyltransferase [Clostridiales bacterium]|jgi:1-acyl-sn-glycerol-3-phosphate acyltransferase|nr:1-acyl-sn-glycerol-3-phosphate acyltransferase [Clostridiales bacterium]
MLLLRSILWYAHFVISVITLTPRLILLRKKKNTTPPGAYAENVYNTAYRWSQSQIKWSGSRFHVAGLENVPANGPVLYVANHQSIFDVGVFLAYLPFPKGFIVKAEVLKLPLVRSWIQEMESVFMDRQSIKNSARAILKGIETLKSGHSMVIFPEGHRSRGGPPGEFKAGSFKLALKSKAPIVPVTIEGTYKALEANHFLVKPADITVTVHPPVETADLTREEALQIPEKIKNMILSALPGRSSGQSSGRLPERSV